MSISQEGIEEHINRYFELKGLPHTYQDVVNLHRMRIGGKPLPMIQQAKELGMENSRGVLYGWYKHLDAK